MLGCLQNYLIRQVYFLKVPIVQCIDFLILFNTYLKIPNNPISLARSIKFLFWGCSLSLSFQHMTLAWNNFVISRLVLLTANWKCQISFKNRYFRLLVFHMLPLLNPSYIIEMQPAQVLSRGITLVDIHLNWFSWFYFLILLGYLLVILIVFVIFLPPLLDVARMSMSTVSLYKQLDYKIFFLENALF